MNKEQFIKSVKLRGKVIYLKRLKAEMENNPQGKQMVQPSKQDYMKAAGQILREMFTGNNKEQNNFAPEEKTDKK